MTVLDPARGASMSILPGRETDFPYSALGVGWGSELGGGGAEWGAGKVPQRRITVRIAGEETRRKINDPHVAGK